MGIRATGDLQDDFTVVTCTGVTHRNRISAAIRTGSCSNHGFTRHINLRDTCCCNRSCNTATCFLINFIQITSKLIYTIRQARNCSGIAQCIIHISFIHRIGRCCCITYVLNAVAAQVHGGIGLNVHRTANVCGTAQVRRSGHSEIVCSHTVHADITRQGNT